MIFKNPEGFLNLKTFSLWWYFFTRRVRETASYEAHAVQAI